MVKFTRYKMLNEIGANVFICIFSLKLGLTMQSNLVIAPKFSRFTRSIYFKYGNFFVKLLYKKNSSRF